MRSEWSLSMEPILWSELWCHIIKFIFQYLINEKSCTVQRCSLKIVKFVMNFNFPPPFIYDRISLCSFYLCQISLETFGTIERWFEFKDDQWRIITFRLYIPQAKAVTSGAEPVQWAPPLWECPSHCAPPENTQTTSSIEGERFLTIWTLQIVSPKSPWAFES